MSAFHVVGVSMSIEPYANKLTFKQFLSEVQSLANIADVYSQLVFYEVDSPVRVLHGPLASICKVRIGDFIIKYYVRGNLEVNVEVYKNTNDESKGKFVYTSNDPAAALVFLQKHFCVRSVEAFLWRLRNRCLSDNNGIILSTITSSASSFEGMTYAAHVNFFAHSIDISMDITVNSKSDVRIYITDADTETTKVKESVLEAENHINLLLRESSKT